MKDKKRQEKPQEKSQDLEVKIIEPQSLDKPQKDTEFAHASAKVLMDIVKKNNWSRKLGGQSEHLQYEAWQTVGKYYGYTVKTGDAEFIELAGIQGFSAKAIVINENTGLEVGGAQAYCMRDEYNWSKKPSFQLASMAQTRAGSKALRQILGFVVALAGYNPTPIEEMTGDEFDNSKTKEPKNDLITQPQISLIFKLLNDTGYTEKDLKIKYEIASMKELTLEQASTIIDNLLKLPKKQKEKTTEGLTDKDYDDFEKSMEK